MTTSRIDISARAVPKLGGFSTRVLSIELRRMLRNRRTVIFTLIMPVGLYLLIISANSSMSSQHAGRGNVSAWVMINMAAYGAMFASTSGGAVVATERALGWSRQLRLTPLSPVTYVLLKSVVALLLGLFAVLAVYVVGLITGKPQMPTWAWLASAVIAWLGSIVFGALGLFVGYLMPSENVMQILGPLMAVMALVGSIFWPINPRSTLGHISSFTPVYGLGCLARWPLLGGSLHLAWVLNILVWLAVFVAGSAWRMSKDTKRV